MTFPSRRLFLVPCFLILTLLLGLGPTAVPASAQETAAQTAAEPATTQELEALLRTLQDPGQREQLVRQLQALVEAQKETRAAPPEEGVGTRVLGALSDRVEAISDDLVAAAALVVDAPRIFEWIGRQVGDPEARARLFQVVAKLLIVLIAGIVAERLAHFVLSRPRRNIEARATESVLLRLLFLLVRTVIDVLPIVAFAAAAFAVLPLTEPSRTTRLVALAFINASVVARVIVAVARAALVPKAAGLRLLGLSDETATYGYIWVRRLTNVGVYGYFAAQAALLLGLPEGGHTVLLQILGAVVAAMLVILVLQNRAAVADWLRGAREEEERARALRGLRRLFAEIWHVLAIVYVVALFLVWALRIEGGFEYVGRATLLTVIILAAAKLLIGAFRRGINRTFAISEDYKQRFPSLEQRANRYLPILNGAVRAVVWIFAALAILQAWGADSLAWLGSDFGQRFTGGVVTIAIILCIAFLVWEFASLSIERYLNRLETGATAARSARLRTLLPLLRTTLAVVLVVVVSLIVLSEIGVNIGPLLAGAGVIGLAIGFGSQKLVQDIINGLFILLEDQVQVGDVVQVAGHAGLVEAISIRTIRLRDLSGRVHVIPFSSVDTVENFTKDFSMYVFDVGVAYREDVDEVIRVLKEIGAEMQADPVFGPNILEPLEILGVDAFADSAVIVKARIKTLPIKQWMTGREFNRRMKKRFDELGIEIPFPHRTLYFGVDKAGEAPPARVAMEEEKKAAPAEPKGEAPERPPRAAS